MRYLLRTLIVVAIGGCTLVSMASMVVLIFTWLWESEHVSYWGHPVRSATRTLPFAEQNYEVWYTSLHKSESLTDAVVVIDDLVNANIDELGHLLSKSRSLNVHFVRILSADEICVRSWDGNRNGPGRPFDGIMSRIMVLDQRCRGRDNTPVDVRCGDAEVSITYVNDWGHFWLRKIRGPISCIRDYASVVKSHSP